MEPKVTGWSSWVKREISVGNLMLFLTMLGAIGAGLYQGGAIQASLVEGIKTESLLRVEGTRALNDRIQSVSDNVRGVSSDVRELRSIVISSAIQPQPGRH